MEIKLQNKYLQSQYEGYKIEAGKIKKALQQTDRISEGKASGDTAVISEEGRKALQDKMSAFAKTGVATEVRKMSSVSSIGYCNEFEKILSEISNASVSKQDETDKFDSHVNKMVSAYQMMKGAIEKKYADPDREQEYYVADDGSVQELTREKELEMLDRAYEKHSAFMAETMEIWAELKDFKPQVIYDSKGINKETEELPKTYADNKKGEIRNYAYQVFMAAISSKTATKE